MTNETDDQLLVRFHLGDESALDSLFLRHYAPVYRSLYLLIGNKESAEDLATETFLTLKAHPPHPRPGVPLKAWLLRVALNHGHNHNRSAQREAARMARIGSEMSFESVDPMKIVIENETKNDIHNILQTLPEHQAKILLLRSSGLSYKEVAEAMQIAPGSVGTYLARAEKNFAASVRGLSPNTALDEKNRSAAAEPRTQNDVKY